MRDKGKIGAYNEYGKLHEVIVGKVEDDAVMFGWYDGMSFIDKKFWPVMQNSIPPTDFIWRYPRSCIIVPGKLIWKFWDKICGAPVARPYSGSAIKKLTSVSDCQLCAYKRGRRDSNSQPPDRQSGTLTN